ncbi:MAG: lysophospholipid acyltransferase family protein [Candidatus Omnitrophota bacterium]
MLYRLSNFLVYCFSKLFCELKIEGREAIPKLGPFILASNHLSNLDPIFLVIGSPRKVGFLAKEELFKNKLAILYLKDVGAIPLKRGKSDIKAMRLALKTLKVKPLLVFPQGTRGESFEVTNNGVGFLCKKAGVPVIAARIYGTDKVFSKGVRLFHKSKVRVIFAQVDNIEKADSYANIAQKVISKIANL